MGGGVEGVADSDGGVAYRFDDSQPAPRTSAGVAGGLRRQGCGGVRETLDGGRQKWQFSATIPLGSSTRQDKLAAMKKTGLILMAVVIFRFTEAAQTPTDAGFKLVLPEHRGQLSWSAEGFKIVQYSAKPEGHEIGIRAK